MTFTSPRFLTTFAVLVAAVGLSVMACEPYRSSTGYTAGYTVPPGIALPCPTPAPAYYVPAPPPVAPSQACYPYAGNTWTLTAADAKIHVQTSEGMRSTCEKLSFLINGSDSVNVSLAGKQVRITSGKDVKNADTLDGTADRVVRSTTDGGFLTLEGNAKFFCSRHGKKMEATADRISINLTTGQIVSEMGPQLPVPQVQPVYTPDCPIPPTVPAPASATGVVPSTTPAPSAPSPSAPMSSVTEDPLIRPQSLSPR